MIKAVIFDLWQTTLCSNGSIGGTLIKEFDLPMKKEEEFWSVLEDDWMKHNFESFEQSAVHACRILGVTDKKKIKKFAALYKDALAIACPYDDVIPAIKKLKKSYKIGLLSNTENLIIPLLEDKFVKLFDAAFFSCDHKRIKPDKKFFRAILKSLDVKPQEAVMIGDSMKNDILPAREMGMKAIFVDRHGKHPEIGERIASLKGLEKIIEKM